VDHAKGKVVFWIPGGLHIMLRVEGALAAALRFRGVEVHAVICNAPYRGCIQREIGQHASIDDWSRECISCQKYNTGQLHRLGVEHSFIGDYVSEQERTRLWERAQLARWDDLEQLNEGGTDLAKNVRSAMIRYLQGWPFEKHDDVLVEFAFSGLVVQAAAKKCLDQHRPSRVFMSHGIYVDWGPMLQETLGRSIPISVWMNSYLPGFFYFNSLERVDEIDFHRISAPAWAARDSKSLTDAQEQQLDDYLSARYNKNMSIDVKEWSSVRKTRSELCTQLELREDRPIFAVMAHVNWDAVCDYAEMAYANFDEWIVATVEEVSHITNVQWLIKAHPAEAKTNPDSGVEALVRKHFPVLPEHIRMIPSSAEINPLDFYELIDGGVTVYGTGGLEVLLFGKPLILAGKAHYSNKGFTYDGAIRQEYLSFLKQAAELPPLTHEQQSRVRRMAYCHFIQRQIPFPVISYARDTWWTFEPERKELLMPGANPLVDFICDRIMDGKDFILDDILVASALELRPQGTIA
jgi:hypothetical protein